MTDGGRKTMEMETETKRFGLSLGGYEIPIDIRQPDAGGQVGLGGHFHFTFQWRMLRFQADYREEDGAVLDLSSDLGPFPYTAESPEARAAAKAILRQANAALGPVFQIHRGRIHLLRRLAVPLPVTVVGLVTAITGFLLKLSPYLDCLSAVMATPVETAKGAPRLRPAYRRPPPARRGRVTSAP